MSFVHRLPSLLSFLGRWTAVGLVFAAVVVLWQQRPGPPAQLVVPSAFTVPAVERAHQSVVSISAQRVVRPRPVLPDNPAAMRFFGTTPVAPERGALQRSVGSAVVVKENGYLLTNRHVVAGYDELQVLLNDGRAVAATIVGSDADTDLAVLKVDLDGLPAIEFAKPEQLRVGAMVLAIGNPFGFGQSVSLGVISALDRSLNSTAPFIQTDAAINNGSSGGALVNLEGQLVGINALVLNRRLAEGIAFAIPSDVALDVFDQIVQQGFVTRGWMGVGLESAPMIDPRDGQQVSGVRVQGTYVGAPAEQAGIRPGDYILRCNGFEALSAEQVTRIEAQTAPGAKISLQLLRGGVPFDVEFAVIQRPEIAG